MKKILLAAIISVNLFAANAQPPCGFNIKHNELLKNDAAFAAVVKENDTKIKAYITQQQIRFKNGGSTNGVIGTLYTIPVVVHILHTGGAIGSTYNPTDAQVQGAITYLNNVYNGTDASMTAPSSTGAAGNIGIQFALAQRTPTCGSTNGIDRINASAIPGYVANGVNVETTGGASELAAKSFAAWDVTGYYNIYVVNKIDGKDGTSGQFIAGFARFPGSGALDGTVMLATTMRAGSNVLPHEVGHALGLYHTFEGSDLNTQCPANASCKDDGDEICDTDPVTNNVNSSGTYNFSCRTGINTCTGTAYSPNTESNFMAYTNCYTLFTNGQAERMQTVMATLRPGLVAATNQALKPCGSPVTNFSVSAATAQEFGFATVATCRTYSDYTYQMGIGAAATAAATATLSFGGTATRGLDYDITTNGDFINPSTTLNFAAGSTTPLPFTVRVYNDATVEPVETIILNYTLASNGGTAIKGPQAPTLTITITDNDVNPAGAGSGTASLGTNIGYITEAPFNVKQQFQKSQFLYKASELTALGVSAGNLTQLQLFITSKLSKSAFNNFTIKMANTSLNYLIEGNLNVAGSLSTVYTNAAYNTIAGWNVFNLTTPFAYTGGSLAIEICYNKTTTDTDATSAADQVGAYKDGGTANQGNMFWQNGLNCNGSFSTVNLYSEGVKPVIQLAYGANGIPVETTSGSTSTNYIAVGSNDFFYSGTNKLLLKLANISQPLGCVTAAVQEAGNTWQAFKGGFRSSKIFAVTPTTNVTSTTYNAAFYFTNDELGGKVPSTLRIAKTTAATTADATVDNTVIVTPTVTSFGTGGQVFTADFTGFSRFFLIDANVVLSVGLIDFKAVLNTNKDAVISWGTSSEQDVNRFELETSNDGTNFAILGSVASKGNSNIVQRYEYLHVKPNGGTVYYRLKQIFGNGNFIYSNIVSIVVDRSEIVKPFLYPVPAQNNITVNFGTLVTKGQVEVVTADGKVLIRETVNALSIKKDLNISRLPKGFYFIRLTDVGGDETLRFVKQ